MSNLNPLQKTWMIISTIFGAIGMVNITEDIYKWAPFFQDLIDNYQMIWYFLFSWTPFQVPEWIMNYFFFCFIFHSSVFRSLYVRGELSDAEKLPIESKIIVALIWPLYLTSTIYSQFLSVEKYHKHMVKNIDPEVNLEAARKTKEMHLHALQVLGSMLLCFFIFLIISMLIW